MHCSARHLLAALVRRLLHPGADTGTIITQFMSAVKALRWLCCWWCWP